MWRWTNCHGRLILITLEHFNHIYGKRSDFCQDYQVEKRQWGLEANCDEEGDQGDE